MNQTADCDRMIYFWLASLVELGIVSLEKAALWCGGYENFFKASPEILGQSHLFGGENLKKIVAHRDISLLIGSVIEIYFLSQDVMMLFLKS